MPAVADSVSLARRVLARFAAAAGADADLVHRVRLAASEAVTNVVLHAYRDREGTSARAGSVYVGAAVASDGERDELWILVADEGCGLQPRDDSPGAGQGLRLIVDAADEVTIIQRAEGGTELQMRFDLGSGNAHRRTPATAGVGTALAVSS